MCSALHSFIHSLMEDLVSTFKCQGLVPSIGAAGESIRGIISALKELRGSRGTQVSKQVITNQSCNERRRQAAVGMNGMLYPSQALGVREGTWRECCLS